MSQPNSTQFIVLKFGGTSVATRKRWEVIGAVGKTSVAQGLKPVVVCSAVSGASNMLEGLIQKIVQGEDFRQPFDSFKQTHVALAKDLSLNPQALLEPDFTTLERILLGASLIQEISPRVHAHIMAFGELMATRLGAAFLNAQGIKTAWIDAREHLKAHSTSHHNAQRQYLSATCPFDEDRDLQRRFAAIPESVILTQGFIAKNTDNQTVLLGRGGSDTSASYFAAKLHATRCEIWTDVPGMYTANPRQIAEARLLKQLDYDEAQEIATMGAKVLHPRCIAPVKQFNIPLHIRCTQEPDMPGTVISHITSTGAARVKSISTKTNITLIAIESLGMWQEVGFLADLFACFKNHGLSIDLVSTSETNVTVSIDPLTNALHPSVMMPMLKDLEHFGKVQAISPCAVVSLVGRNIRSILHQLGPVLEVFEEQKVYLVSQAASDLNLSFVVQEDEANRLVQKLHHLLFDNSGSDPAFGPSWQDTFLQHAASPDQKTAPWWQNKKSTLLRLTSELSPRYVYDEETLVQSTRLLRSLQSIDRIFYAIKANDHDDVLRTFFNQNLGFECVSVGELQRVFALFPNLDPDRVLFTPNFAPKEEYEEGLARGCHVTLDNLYPLEHWPELFTGKKLFLRLDPGQGRGHHQHVQTAGEQSKFGISRQEIGHALSLIKRHQVVVEGLHAHAGSGIASPQHWSDVALFLIQMAQQFDDVTILDLGGGLAVPTRARDEALDLQTLDQTLRDIRAAHPQFQFWLEPGRYLVANAGVLLARVTQLKEKNETKFVGVDAGMNSLIRPTLYGAYHHIVNLSHLDEAPSLTAHVVGPICESGDTLGYDRQLPPTTEGDVLLIATAGAYGHVMGSHYNRREPASEYFLKAKE